MRNLKRVLSLALALVMVLGMMVIGTSAAGFADAEKVTYEEAVAVMAGVGLFKGDDKGNVNPDVVLTRKDAATLMARIMLGGKYATLDDKTAGQVFTDVPAGAWYAAEVEYCYNKGLIGGLGNGTFDPDGKLTGIAFAKLLLVACGYNAEAQGYGGKDWATNIAIDALAAGLYIDGVDITKELTREQAAQMLLQLLEYDEWTYDYYYDEYEPTGANMVGYINSFDPATGATTLIGPSSSAIPEDKDTFAEVYFPGLYKYTGIHGMWGRPIDFVWVYQDEEIYGVMKQPVKVYTEFVTQCDIADDLGLRKDTDISMVTWNNNSWDPDSEVVLTETEYGWGAQGRLLEIYSDGRGGLEFVIIDTFLARVTDVLDRTFDRNNHVDEAAELHLGVYYEYEIDFEDETDDLDEYTEMVLTSKRADFDYKVGEWVLVYVDESEYAYNDCEDEDDLVPYIIGAPETMTGAQTAWTFNNQTHEVEDKEYNDAVAFLLDQTDRHETGEHTWFFDQYGNLIGAIDPAKAPDTYGVIAQIYWKDSRDGELGYAYAKIVYMDGSYEWKTVYSINGKVLEGVEGKEAIYSEGDVSSTKQYNEYGVSPDSDFTNRALYKIRNGRNGLILVDADEIAGQLTTNKKTVIEDEVYVNSKTMFLVYNSRKDTYTSYVGVRNLPDYENDEIPMWVADIEEDTNAEYVFVIDPQGPETEDEVEKVLVVGDYDEVKWTYKLKDNIRVSVKYSNLLVNGEDGSVLFDIFDEDDEKQEALDELVYDFLDGLDEGWPMVLTITNGYVSKVEFVSDDEIVLAARPKTSVVCAGVLVDDFDNVDADSCYYEADDETLYVDGEWYDVADAELIGARNWRAADGNILVIVYDKDLTVSTVYVIEW